MTRTIFFEQQCTRVFSIKFEFNQFMFFRMYSYNDAEEAAKLCIRRSCMFAELRMMAVYLTWLLDSMHLLTFI